MKTTLRWQYDTVTAVTIQQFGCIILAQKNEFVFVTPMLMLFVLLWKYSLFLI